MLPLSPFSLSFHLFRFLLYFLIGLPECTSSLMGESLPILVHFASVIRLRFLLSILESILSRLLCIFKIEWAALEWA